MVTKVAVLPGSATEKAVVMASSFVTGVVLGSVSKYKATWGMPITIGVGVLGIAGAFFMSGTIGTMAEGLANASLATLGASIPFYIGTGSGSTAAKALPPAARRALPAAAPRDARVALSPEFDASKMQMM